MAANGTKTGRYEFDETDRRILELLKANGRATNQKIARDLKVSAATVSARIRQMEEAKAMKVVAATDFAAFGYDTLIAIGVEVQGRPAEDVAKEFAKLPQVLSINLVTGARDIEILLAVQEFSDLSDFLLKDVAAIKGVRNLSPAIAVEIVKFDFDVAPLVTTTSTARYQLDSFDHQILEVLAEDARLSNRKIAQTLGVTEGTIRGRLKRLQEENYLRFTAIVAPSYLGSPLLVFIGVTAEQGRVREVARLVAEMEGIRSVIITLGRFNIHVVGMYSSLEEVLNVANNAILALPGVRHVETSISVKQLKYDSRLAKITRPFVPVEDDDE